MYWCIGILVYLCICVIVYWYSGSAFFPLPVHCSLIMVHYFELPLHLGKYGICPYALFTNHESRLLVYWCIVHPSTHSRITIHKSQINWTIHELPLHLGKYGICPYALFTNHESLITNHNQYLTL